MSSVITQRDDYNSGHSCTWCPGCGNYAIWYMLKQALLELGIEPHTVVIVYDVGCSGNGSNFTHTYGFHGLHGRALPVAQGIKLTNNKLKVIVVGGDGGGLGIGAGHFLHACRRNIDITYLMHDNQIYGLTTGQASPRSDKGMVTKTTPEGNFETPVNPIGIALTANASFIGRAFSGSPHHLKDMIKAAIMHKGFSFVDILQPCITFNKQNTYAWYTERIYDLQKENHNHTLKDTAWIKSNEWGDRIPTGIFYKVNTQTYEEYVAIKENPAEKSITSPVRVDSLLKQFKI